MTENTYASEVAALQSEVRSLRKIVLATVALAALGLIGATADRLNTSFDAITVHRINLIDNDGTLRLAISNKENFPPSIMHGKPFGVGMHLRSVGEAPSFVYYNENGDEQGGFRWGGSGSANGTFNQFMSFSADQFEQNDDLIMHYSDSTQGSEAWLSGQAQVDTTPLDVLATELQSAVARGKTPAEQDEIGRNFVEQHYQGRQRFFIGYTPDASKVSLYDKQGNPRVTLVVGPTGEPKLVFLDAHGKVTYQIAPESKGER